MGLLTPKGLQERESTIDQQQFHSIHHYIQSQKVHDFGSEAALDQILALRPSSSSVESQRLFNEQIQEISGHLHDFDKALWERIEIEALFVAYLAKAEQCREFRRELLSTQEREIILYGVKWWGMSPGLSTARSGLHGKNQMGKLLQDVRQKVQEDELEQRM